jgi:hypothetical protein
MPSTKRFLFLAVATIFATLHLASASASVITFDGLAHEDRYPLYGYVEDGFLVTGSGSFVEWHRYGNPAPSILTGWPGGFGGLRTAVVTSVEGSLFAFDGFEFGPATGVVSYTVRGLREGLDAFEPMTGNNSEAWTHVLGDSSTLLDTLIITLTRINAYSAYVDNIGVTAINEPAALALVAVGLVGLAATRRRVRADANTRGCAGKRNRVALHRTTPEAKLDASE